MSVRAVARPVVIQLPTVTVAPDVDAVQAAMEKAVDEPTRLAIKRGTGTILTLESGKLWKLRDQPPETGPGRMLVDSWAVA